MNDTYIVYRCLICGNHFVLMSNEVTHSEEESKFITCPYHGKHKQIIVVHKYENIEECMGHDSYVKESGKVKQRGWGSG